MWVCDPLRKAQEFVVDDHRSSQAPAAPVACPCCSRSWVVLCGTRVEHHCCAERVEGRAWGGGRRPLGETGGVALDRGGQGGLLAWGYTYTDRLGNRDVDIVGCWFVGRGRHAHGRADHRRCLVSADRCQLLEDADSGSP